MINGKYCTSVLLAMDLLNTAVSHLLGSKKILQILVAILPKSRSGEKAREYLDKLSGFTTDYLLVVQGLSVHKLLLTTAEMMGFSEQQLLKADLHSG